MPFLQARAVKQRSPNTPHSEASWMEENVFVGIVLDERARHIYKFFAIRFVVKSKTF